MKLDGNLFRTILHISFFEADVFLGGGAETDPRPDRRPSAYPRRILEILETVYIVNASLCTRCLDA